MPALWATALIFVISGVAKLLSPGSTQAAFDSLKVPQQFNHPHLVRAFPFLELLLALTLVQPWAPLQVLGALVATALMVAFLLLVLGARQAGEPCHCFGAASTQPVTARTITRNILFLIIALGGLLEAVLAVARGTGVGLGLSTGGGGDLAWLILIASLVAACALIVGRESVPTPTTMAPAPAAPGFPATPASVPATTSTTTRPDDDHDADVARHPIPETPVIVDQHIHTLANLSREQAMLVFRLNPGCGSCDIVLDDLRTWGESIGPVALRLIVPIERLDMPLFRLEGIPEAIILRDPTGISSTTLGLSTYPSAVLLGTDGLTAGGPALGYDAVMDLVTEVREIFDPASNTTPEGPTA